MRDLTLPPRHKTFLTFYLPCCLIFVLFFIANDWLEKVIGQPDIVEIVESQDQIAEAFARRIATSDQPTLASFSLLIPAESPHRLQKFAIVTPAQADLSEDDLAYLAAQNWLIYEEPNTQRWELYLPGKSPDQVFEFVFETSSNQLLSSLATLVLAVLCLLLLGVLLWWLLDKIHNEFTVSSSALDNIAHQLDMPISQDKAPNRAATRAATLTGKIRYLERNLQKESQQRVRHYDELRDLLHGVAHEFRSPMARLSFALDMAEAEQPKPAVKELIEQMSQALTELDMLVKEVLNYSRLEHGVSELKREEVSVSETVKKIIEQQQQLHPQLFFEDLSADTTIIVDSQLFHRAVVNLVRNAARFAESRVRINCQHHVIGFLFTVEDDGPGIPPGKRARIFEPFTRLDPSRSRDSGGSGLGLAIVKSISTLHQGRVEVSDSPLGGALFTLRWPQK